MEQYRLFVRNIVAQYDFDIKKLFDNKPPQQRGCLYEHIACLLSDTINWTQVPPHDRMKCDITFRKDCGIDGLNLEDKIVMQAKHYGDRIPWSGVAKFLALSYSSDIFREFKKVLYGHNCECSRVQAHKYEYMKTSDEVVNHKNIKPLFRDIYTGKKAITAEQNQRFEELLVRYGHKSDWKPKSWKRKFNVLLDS